MDHAIGTTTQTASGSIYAPARNQSFTYDDDENILSDGRWTYTWDHENRLIQMQTVSGNPAPAKTITFKYDVLSRRIRKTETN